MVTDSARQRLSLPENVVPPRTHCFMHQCSRMALEVFKRSGLDVLNRIFSMSHLLYMAKYWHTFTTAACDVAMEDLENGGWFTTQEPPALGELQKRVLAVAWPDMHLLGAKRCRQLRWALSVLNGDWTTCCAQTSVQPCAPCPAACVRVEGFEGQHLAICDCNLGIALRSNHIFQVHSLQLQPRDWLGPDLRCWE